MALSRLCQSRPKKPGRTVRIADQIETIRDRIANVEAVRRSYQRQLDGGEPRRVGRPIPDKTLRENIARTTARIVELNQQLAALKS